MHGLTSAHKLTNSMNGLLEPTPHMRAQSTALRLPNNLYGPLQL